MVDNSSRWASIQPAAYVDLRSVSLGEIGRGRVGLGRLPFGVLCCYQTFEPRCEGVASAVFLSILGVCKKQKD